MTTEHDARPEAPRYPRAPSHAVWESMSPAERAAVVASLPGYMTDAECLPSEGDEHFDAVAGGRETLRTHFARAGARIYVGADMTVYYPDEERFAPDLFAVRDVDTGPRDKWVVDAEGRGLEWVMEVLVRGDRRKDLEANVSRYARLLIPEYFVFDYGRRSLRAWRLADPKIGVYTPIVPQHGAYPSEVLGMELFVEDRRVRFRRGNAFIDSPQDLILRLEDHVNDAVMARETAEQERDELSLRLTEVERERDDIQRERDEARARLAALEAEIARLRGG